MKKLLAFLLLPAACFCASRPAPTPVPPAPKEERVQLDYIWREILTNDLQLAHYHLYKERPTNPEDIMYVNLTKMYVALCQRDKKQFVKIAGKIEKQARSIFGEIE